MSRQRAQAALAALATAGSLGLAACGGGDEGADQADAPPACAPELAELLVDEQKPEVVAAAREGRFGIRKLKLRLDPPIDWEQNPVKSSSFQGKLQDLTWLDVLLFAYLEGDRRALAQARDIALDWIAANPFVNPYVEGKVRGDPKPWIDKIAAERVAVLAWLTAAADCERILDPAERRTLRAALALHGSYLADNANYHRTNHGLYVDRGLDMLSRLAPDLPLAKRWGHVAERRFLRNLRAHLARGEGFWLEHSAGYQLAIARLVERFAELGDRSEAFEATRAAMRDAAGWVIEPDGQVVLYGDTDLKRPTEEELAVAAGQSGLRWMPESGLAFVKRQDPGAYLAVFASFHSDTHKDADDLSFDLFDAETRIVSDTGLYHKDMDEFLEFQDSPRAHSVLRTETDVPITDANAYGSGLDARGAAAGWYAVLANNPLLERQGVEHERLFLYRPGYALIVYDRVRSERPHTYQRLFQLGPDVKVDRRPAGLRLESPELDGSLTSTATAEQRIDLARGERDPLAGFVFPRFREAVPRPTVTYTSEATDLDATATFGIEAGLEPRAKALPDPDGFRIRIATVAGEPETIRVRRHGARLELEVPPALAGQPAP